MGVLKASVYEFPTDFEKEQHFYESEQGEAESFLSGLMLETKNLATYIPDTYKLYMKKACEFCELPNIVMQQNTYT